MAGAASSVSCSSTGIVVGAGLVVEEDRREGGC